MNYLLIDIGNTRIKCSLSADGKMSSPELFTYEKEMFRKHFRVLLNRYKGRFDEVYVSSLNKNFNKIIKTIISDFKVRFIIAKSSLPIRFDYAKTLGSDRICSAVGAYSKYRKHRNILVIDLGTATTFNIISNGIYRGGMISAGIKTASEALLKKTTLPNVVLNSRTNLVNRTTKSAVISGLILQQVFFIEKSIEEYRKLFERLFVVITGGGSEIFGNKIKGVNKIELHLVLEGLNILATYNSKCNETIR
ncbi:MAG: type III pantothenate kinase [Ignavibacteria bacterium]